MFIITWSGHFIVYIYVYDIPPRDVNEAYYIYIDLFLSVLLCQFL